MPVGIKDSFKLLGISIIACCAVFVCTLFLSYNADMAEVKELISSEASMMFYNAQKATAEVASAASGGCLCAASVVMLFFYIRNYIDTHKKELGILKALGYSDLKTASGFWVFGLSVFLGAAVGFCGALLTMPAFYALQNKDKILPEVLFHFRIKLPLLLVILPTAAFSAVSVLYALFKLKAPAAELMRGRDRDFSRVKKHGERHEGLSFLNRLKRNTLSRKTLVFFVIFASFCFSAMTQMSFKMKDLASVEMGAMIMVIGLVLAFTTLFLAITTVINGNKKTIAMMRAFGYEKNECRRALLGGYRPMGYVGFALGTVYQYVLLKIMVSVVFEGIAGVPEYSFDFTMMFISLAVFIAAYEAIMYFCSERIKGISIKEIMQE